MPAHAITHAKPDLSDAQRAALVQLLADEDPQVFRRIFDTLLAQGPSARAWLEPHRLSDDARIRRRVSGVIDRLVRAVTRAAHDLRPAVSTASRRRDDPAGEPAQAGPFAPASRVAAAAASTGSNRAPSARCKTTTCWCCSVHCAARLISAC